MMDLNMPVMNGIQSCEKIKKHFEFINSNLE